MESSSAKPQPRRLAATSGRTRRRTDKVIRGSLIRLSYYAFGSSPRGVPQPCSHVEGRGLNAVCETDFLGFSYGFRSGRSAHIALDALAVGIETKKVNWLLDADIRGFFDT